MLFLVTTKVFILYLKLNTGSWGRTGSQNVDFIGFSKFMCKICVKSAFIRVFCCSPL